MNKKFLKGGSLLLATIMLAMSFASCGKKAEFTEPYSLKAKATIQAYDAENAEKSKLSGTDSDYIDVSFQEPTIVDTIVLCEKDENILDFEILAEQDGELKSIYQQDKVGAYRYCAFPDTKTEKLRVRINKTREGSFNLKSLDVLNVQKDAPEDFRITTYAVANTIYNPENLDKKHFEVITDVILFGAITFDEQGSLHFAEYEIDGEKVDGKTVLLKNIENLRAVEGEKPLKIYVNILGPNGKDYKDKEKIHTEIFKNFGEQLNQNILSVLDDLSLDGIYFDYEYPYTKKSWKAFSDYLVTLDKALGDYKLGIAVGPWGGALHKDAKNAVDYFEVMAYDMFDDDGYHGSFATTGGVHALKFMGDKGYDLQKCHFGVPFYSRPVDRDAIWLDYKSAYEKLGKFGNVDDSSIEVNDKKDYTVPRYYNSYQMIFDKTAFAADANIGGMMIWHYACDVPVDTELSLFAAMQEALNSRNA